jgi:hypothetical protein
VDLQIGDEPYDPVNMEAVRREKQVEVRMLIKRVDNIKIFRDFGERNDVRVEGTLITEDFYGTLRRQKFQTDTHQWANTFASFNWRWLFTLNVPLASARMEFRLLDEDRVTLGGKSKQVIYDTVSYSLDRIFATFRDVAGAQQEDKPEKLLSETVVFSNIQKEDLNTYEMQLLRDRKGESSWKCCKNLLLCCIHPFNVAWKKCCGSGVQEMTDFDAKMQIEVEVWPVSLADRDPVGGDRGSGSGGRSGPHPPEAPEGRYDMAYFARHPGKFCAKLMGPRNFWRFQWFVRSLFWTVIFLIVSYVLYFLMNSWFPLVGIRFDP